MRHDFDYRQSKVPKLKQYPVWKRYEPGWYRTLIGDRVVEIKNMQGQSVLYSGLGQHVQVRVDGVNDEYGSGSREVSVHYTIREAKQWVEDNLVRAA
jgi:hypothetical protein